MLKTLFVLFMVNQAVNHDKLINLKVVTCTNGVLFRGFCSLIHLKSQTGEMEVLPSHVSLLSGIVEGSVMHVVDEFNSKITIELKSSGFLVFNQNECLVTIEDAKIQTSAASSQQAKVA